MRCVQLKLNSLFKIVLLKKAAAPSVLIKFKVVLGQP